MGTHEHAMPVVFNCGPHILAYDIYFCLARFIVNITHHQYNNNRILQGIYCYACYLMGHLVYNYVKPHETGQIKPRVGHPSAIVFNVSAKWKWTYIWMHFGLLSVNCKLCFWSVQNLSDDAEVTVDFSVTFI